MGEGVMTRFVPLLEPLIFSLPSFSGFLVFNLGLTLVTVACALYLLYLNRCLLVRPAYYCVVGWVFLYQAPISIFSAEFSESLKHAWKWSAMIHLVSFTLLIWCAWVSLRKNVKLQSFRFAFPALGLVEQLLPVGLLLLAVAIYFYVVPYDCTGLYALWADPWMTLLAREFSIKLIGSSLATYSLGAAANIISPLTVAFSIFQAKKCLLRKRYLTLFVWLGVGVLAVVLVLTSGVKGLLIPTLVMAILVSLLWGDSWRSRVVMMVAAVGLVMSTMVFFELARERDSIAGSRYDFARCVVETNTCPQSLVLVKSLGYREGSLGLSNQLLEQVTGRLSCMCSAQGEEGHCPAVDVPTSRPKGVNRTDRATTLLQAILRRAFAVPFQVSAWHLMYSESEAVDGWKTLPFARRFFGDSLNMPELVYQKYGTIYSKGDRTGTSTAPTSFLMFYPAYLGFAGFIIALGCLLVWDFIYAFLALRLRGGLVPIAAGMAAITSMNFMSSDFVTVLISHGGLAGLGVIICFICLRIFRGVRCSSHNERG